MSVEVCKSVIFCAFIKDFYHRFSLYINGISRTRVHSFAVVGTYLSICGKPSCIRLPSVAMPYFNRSLLPTSAILSRFSHKTKRTGSTPPTKAFKSTSSNIFLLSTFMETLSRRNAFCILTYSHHHLRTETPALSNCLAACLFAPSVPRSFRR